MEQTWRTVRVFISSTFRDMHAEREELIKRICRELGNPEGLARSLANQAVAVKDMRRVQEALRLAQEAYRLATDHGLTVLAQQIKRMLDLVRSKLR